MKKMIAVLMASLSVLAFSGAAALAEVQSNVQATVAGTKGTVEFAPPGSTDFKPVTQDVPIPPGSTLRTGRSGQATIVPFPGVALTLSPNTVLQTSTMNIATEGNRISKKSALMDLKQGMATVVIDHKAAKKIPVDFKVKTPTSVASAVGTKYVVAVIGGITYVKVLEGTINFGPDGGAVTPINSTSGVARLNADGTVTFVPDGELPGDVTVALNNAPVEETEGVIGATPETFFAGRNPLLNPSNNPQNTIQQQISPEQ